MIARARSHVPAVLAALLMGVVWLAMGSAPLALGGDNESLTHPLLVDAFRQLAGGTLPVRTAGRWGGSPVAGDPVVGALYAPYYLGYAVTMFPHVRALDVAVIVHLGILVVGAAWWLRGLDVRPGTALVGAVLIGITPTLVFAARGWIQYWAAIAWWPWLFGATVRLAARPSVAHAVVAAAALALPTYAGYPQFALYGGMVGLGWLVACPGVAWSRRIALALVVATGGLGLAAPALVAGIATSTVSIRGGPGGDAMLASFDVFRLPPSAWPQLVHGSPLTPAMSWRIPPIVVVLALVGALQRSRTPVYVATCAALALVLAAGGALFRVVHAIPPFAFFGGPVKLFYLFIVLATGLAALGLDRLRDAPATLQRVALAIVAAVSVAGSPIVGAPVGALALACAALPGRRLGTAITGAALASATAFLVSTQALVAPHFSTAGAFTPLLHEPPERFGIDATAGRWVGLEAGTRLRQVGMNFGSQWDVPSWSGVGPLVSWRQHAVMEDADPDAAVALADQIGAAGVVVRAGDTLAASFRRAGFSPSRPHAGLEALRRPGPPPPRFLLVPHAVALQDALGAARAGQALTADRVVLEAPVAGPLDGDSHGTLVVLEEHHDAARLRVEIDRPTWLVVRDPYHPSWEATIADARAQLVPAAGFLQALLVPAGRHEVVLRYRERGLARGGLLLVLTALALPAVLRALVARPQAARGSG